ncbi:MAG: sigma 54-interacting transcriptional regulator [Acidobacteriota bacterium]|nr:sigma 54-interacting transcriptional regulator [Acidobacteriota bacterium]
MRSSLPNSFGEAAEDANAPPSKVADIQLKRKASDAARREKLRAEVEAIRELLDRGASTEAEGRARQLIENAARDSSLLAEARCSLSLALEMQARYRESFEAVAVYESPQEREALPASTAATVWVQVARAYITTGDHPKAIALLNMALRQAAGDELDDDLGAIYTVLARAYRAINEHPIARDYAYKALEHYRRTGYWRGLSEAYFALALSDFYESDYDAAIAHYEQAIKLVGDRPAHYLLGKLYGNMAGICSFVRRPEDSIRYLEKAISYYERTEHKESAASAFNNLALNLVLVGDWPRAQAALEQALALATEVSTWSREVAMILDTLGELEIMRGNLAVAESHLERAVALAGDNSNKWYQWQALRTLCRCRLAQEDYASAGASAAETRVLAERIGNRLSICESRLLLAEVRLHAGDLDAVAAELQWVGDETVLDEGELTLTNNVCRLRGLLALAQGDATSALHHFGRNLSVSETLGDRYRTALAHYELGRAYRASAQPERAAEHFAFAVRLFSQLGAKIKLAEAEEALAVLDGKTPDAVQEPSALMQLLMLRLTEAVASRELLLRELVAIVSQETGARQVAVFELDNDKNYVSVVAHGMSDEEAATVAVELKTEGEINAFIARLRPTTVAPAVLYVAPRSSAALAGGAALDPLLRIAELGLEVCALRGAARGNKGANQESSALVDGSLMPGFIHSSPAMTRLVEEVHKIRSSDVTVLVTGESGTGKELVARAIHAISSRRAKIFVPFNCTAVPKELSDAYLFGYKRGAYTGAVADSPGVIRTASGGTLFLDEIGDLPLDVQPKLLRFLQEGEIQPLGEQRPAKVDVRIIAATNSDLERMVAEGRFREDLYYRLNVIRLQVPPLRERRSEIPTIVNYYINHYSAKFGRRDISITPETIDLLMVSAWPGNVRQLCNEIQRVVARSEDSTVISPDHLSLELRRTGTPVAPHEAATHIHADVITLPGAGTTLADALGELERRMIAEALERHGGNISRAARELGLTRRGLYLKLDRLNLSASA